MLDSGCGEFGFLASFSLANTVQNPRVSLRCLGGSKDLKAVTLRTLPFQLHRIHHT